MENVDKRQAILAAASKRFSTYGFHETKMEQVAEEAGVAKGTVYLYFKDKNTLLFEVARYNMARYLQSMQEQIAPFESSQDKLRAYARHHIAQFPEMARFHKLNFEHFMKVTQDKSMLEQIREDQRAVLNVVKEIIEIGIKRGEFREVHVADAALIVTGSLHAYIQQAMLGTIKQQRAEQADELVDLLIQGFGN